MYIYIIKLINGNDDLEEQEEWLVEKERVQQKGKKVNKFVLDC